MAPMMMKALAQLLLGFAVVAAKKGQGGSGGGPKMTFVDVGAGMCCPETTQGCDSHPWETSPSCGTTQKDCEKMCKEYSDCAGVAYAESSSDCSQDQSRCILYRGGGTAQNSSGTGMGYTCYSAQGWRVLGEQIGAKPGESFIGEERFGVAINDKGSRVALAGNGNFGVIGSWPALVRVYDYIMGEWHQVGSDILASDESNGGATALAFDSMGTRVAVGFRRHSTGGLSQNGIVRIYDFDGEYQEGTWKMVGAALAGETSSDMFGEQVAMSGDGMTLAISAIGYDNMRGQVKVFRYANEEWTQLGSDVNGEGEGHESGYSLAISKDGNRIAVGGPKHNGNGASSGHVKIFDWRSGSWEQVEELDGGNAGDMFGSAVALSADGKKCAIGVPGNNGMGEDSGSVRVYEEVGNDWQLVGAAIMGEAAGDMFGSTVSMDENGTRVAAGARYNDAGGEDNAGHARVFDLVGATWVQFGSDLDGAGQLYEFGQHVVLSADGTSLGVTSAPYSGGSPGGLFTFTAESQPAEAATEPGPTSTSMRDFGECTDYVPEGETEWYDIGGDTFTCRAYARFGACATDGDNEDYRNFEKTAGEACCVCGGGVYPTTTTMATGGNEDDNANGAWRPAGEPAGLVLLAVAAAAVASFGAR